MRMHIDVKCLTTCTDHICFGSCIFFVLMHLCCFYYFSVKVKRIINMLMMDYFYMSVRGIPLCCVPAYYGLRTNKAASAQSQ